MASPVTLDNSISGVERQLLWFDARSAAGHGADGVTHAIVIGISRYPYADGGLRRGGREDHDDYGRGQLLGPALGAYHFAEWLKTSYRNPTAPLATVRLVLAPREEERNFYRPLAADSQPPDENHTADADTVLKELYDWWKDCNEQPRSVAVFYASGHGVAFSNDWPLFLTEDFALKRESLLGSLDFTSIREGMQGVKAKQQIYFLDCCWTPYPYTVGLKVFEGRHFVTPDGDGLSARAPVYSSAKEGTEALTADLGGTVFSQALLECLDNCAVERLGTGLIVSTYSLARALQVVVPRVAHEVHKGLKTQTPASREWDDYFVFHHASQLPSAPMHLTLIPPQAKDSVDCTLLGPGRTNAVTPVDFNEGNPYRRRVTAGNYEANVRPSSGMYEPISGLDVTLWPPDEVDCPLDVRRYK